MHRYAIIKINLRRNKFIKVIFIANIIKLQTNINIYLKVRCKRSCEYVYSGYQPFITFMYCKYFPFYALSFHFLNNIFLRANFNF